MRLLHDLRSAAAASIVIVDPPTGGSLSVCQLSQRTGVVLCADAVFVEREAAETNGRRCADGCGCSGATSMRSGMQKNLSAPSSRRENILPRFTYVHANELSAFLFCQAVDSEVNVCVNSVGVSLGAGGRPCRVGH